MKVFNAIVLLCVTSLCFGQTAEEIMDKVSKAMGGDVAKDVKTMVSVGTLSLPGGLTGTLNVYTKEGGKLLVKTAINAPGVKMEMLQGCDGEDCYSNDPNFGLRLLEGQEKEMMQMQNDFQAQLNWRDLYPKHEYRGEGQVDGRKVHQVYLETKEGMGSVNSYDAENYMLLQSEGTANMAMGSLNFKTTFHDYKDVYKGMKAPTRMVTEMMNQRMEMKMDSFEVNVPIPDSKFKLPEGAK